MANVNEAAQETVVAQNAERKSLSVQDYINENPNVVLGVVGGLVALFLAWYLYKNYWVAGQQEEAMGLMWQAEQRFEQDSFNLALNNPGAGNKGFLAIANEYGGTKAGNAAKYYSGVCYLNMGQYDKALEMLESCSADGEILPALLAGSLGDAHAEKKNFDKALSYYNDAAASGDNELLASFNLYKAGRLNEKMGKNAEALKAYTTIRDQYPSSQYAREVEKMIAKMDGVGTK